MKSWGLCQIPVWEIEASVPRMLQVVIKYIPQAWRKSGRETMNWHRQVLLLSTMNLLDWKQGIRRLNSATKWMSSSRDVSETLKDFLSNFCIRMPNFWTWFRHFHLAEYIQVCVCGPLLMITQRINLITSLKVLLPQVFTLFRAMLCALSYWPLPKSHWPLPKSYWQSMSKTNGAGAEWEEFLVLVESYTWHGGGWHLCPNLSNVIFHFPFQMSRVS